MTHILNSIASKHNYIVGEIPYKRKYIVFINPIGGKGKAIATWNNIREVLDKSYINLQLIRTQYYKHAYELVLKLDRNEVLINLKSVTEFYVSLGMGLSMK